MQVLVSAVVAVLSASQIPAQVESTTSSVATDHVAVPQNIEAKVGRYNAKYLSFCYGARLVNITDRQFGAPCQGRDQLQLSAEQFYRRVGLTARAEAVADRKQWAHWTTLGLLGAAAASATYGGVAQALGADTQAVIGIGGATVGLGLALIAYLRESAIGESYDNLDAVQGMADYNDRLLLSLALNERWLPPPDDLSIEPTPGSWRQKLRIVHTYDPGVGMNPSSSDRWRVVIGRESRAVPWPEFFDMTDRPDLQAAYDNRILANNTLFWGGIGTMAAGVGIGIYGTQADGPNRLTRISLGMAIGGLLSYAASGLFGGGPSESEAQAAIDLYNQTRVEPLP